MITDSGTYFSTETTFTSLISSKIRTDSPELRSQPYQFGRTTTTRTQQPLISTQPTNVFQSSLNRAIESTSTEPCQPPIHLYLEFEAIFWTAKGEAFEDGMESSFSRQLSSLVRKYGNDALEVIISLIVYEKVEPEVASEALRWLGRLNHTESYPYRRWLLERSLSLSSARVRDGAVLGLASMDDRHAIPYLKAALEKEPCSELKADMEAVLEQWEN